MKGINPIYAQGDLIKVTGAQNQTEGEFIQALLEEEGVPSVLRRTPGFDVPDFLAAGPRDVMVPQTGGEVASEVLLQADLVDRESAQAGPSPIWVFGLLLGGILFVALLVLLLS